MLGAIIERVQSRYWNFVRLEPVLWEKEPLRATAHFNEELIHPGDCEIFVCVLWSRLGSPLPSQFNREDGSQFDSGTEWELVEACRVFEERSKELGPDHATPNVYLFRRESPRPKLDDPEAEQLAAEQELKLKSFLDDFLFNDDGTIRGSFSTYQTLKQFEENMESHLERVVVKWIKFHADLAPHEEIHPIPIKGSPFMGLGHFDFEHAALFFGRNRAIGETLERLKAAYTEGHPFLLIYGASGYGKSSLMRAGLAPRLIAPGYIREVPHWQRAILLPGQGHGTLTERLVRELFKAIPNLYQAKLGTDQEPCDAASLTRYLNSPNRVAAAVSTITSALDLLNPGSALLLQVDQFEEVFTTNHQTDLERDRFFNAIAALVLSRRVWVVATMRSEYFPKIANYPDLHRLVKHGGDYILSPPELPELHQMIRFPALAAGLQFEKSTTDARELSESLYQEAAQQPDALPLLEFTLQELYEQRDGNRLTWKAYHEMGGIIGAIARRAQETYAKLAPEHRESAINLLFGELVNLSDQGGAVATRKRASLEDLKAIREKNGSTRTCEDFLNCFTEAKLLVTDVDQDGRSTVALAHEALITHWPVLNNWIKQHEFLLRARHRLSDAASLWEESQRDKNQLLSEGRLVAAEEVASSGRFQLSTIEQDLIRISMAKARRRRRLLTATAIIFAILAISAGFLALQAKKSQLLAESSYQEAQKQRLTAEAQEKLAKEQAEIAKRQTLVAKQESQRAERQANIANTEKERAQNAEKETALSLSRADFSLAQQSVQQDQLSQAFAYLSRSLKNHHQNHESAQLAWSLITHHNPHFPQKRFNLGKSSVLATFSPDGKQLLLLDEDGLLKSCQLETNKIKSYGPLKGLLLNKPDSNYKFLSLPQSGELEIIDYTNDLRIRAGTTALGKSQLEPFDPYAERPHRQAYLKWIDQVEEIPAEEEDLFQIWNFPQEIKKQIQALYQGAKTPEDLLMRNMGVARWETNEFALPDGRVIVVDGFPVYRWNFLKSKNLLILECQTYYGDVVIDAISLGGEPQRVRLASAGAGSDLGILVDPSEEFILVHNDTATLLIESDRLEELGYPEELTSREGGDLQSIAAARILTLASPLAIFYDQRSKQLWTLEDASLVSYQINLQGFSRYWSVQTEDDDYDTFLYANPTDTRRLIVEPDTDRQSKARLAGDVKSKKSARIEGGLVSMPSIDYQIMPSSMSDDGSYALVNVLAPDQVAAMDSDPAYLLSLLNLPEMNTSVLGRPGETLLFHSPANHWALLTRLESAAALSVSLATHLNKVPERIELPFKELPSPVFFHEDYENVFVFTATEGFSIQRNDPSVREDLSKEQLAFCRSLLTSESQDYSSGIMDRLSFQELAPVLSGGGLETEVGQRSYNLIKRGSRKLTYCDIDTEWRARTPYSRLIVLSQDRSQILNPGIAGQFTYLSESACHAVTSHGYGASSGLTFWSPSPKESSPPSWLPEFLEAFSGCSLDTNSKLQRVPVKLSAAKAKLIPYSWKSLAEEFRFVPDSDTNATSRHLPR